MGQQFFKVIQQPNEMRKKLLESSKDIIDSLKSYQKILEIRERKYGKIKQLRLQIKEIYIFLDKLVENFPGELVDKFTKEKSKGKKAVKSKAQKKSVAPTELSRLENQLSNIEEKLKRLS